jgi:hypothetical protein
MAGPEQARSQVDADAEVKQLAAALIHEAPREPDSIFAAIDVLVIYLVAYGER